LKKRLKSMRKKIKNLIIVVLFIFSVVYLFIFLLLPTAYLIEQFYMNTLKLTKLQFAILTILAGVCAVIIIAVLESLEDEDKK